MALRSRPHFERIKADESAARTFWLGKRVKNRAKRGEIMKLSQELSSANSLKAMRKNQVPAKPCTGMLDQMMVVGTVPRTIHSELKQQNYLSCCARKTKLAEYYLLILAQGYSRLWQHDFLNDETQCSLKSCKFAKFGKMKRFPYRNGSEKVFLDGIFCNVTVSYEARH